MLKYQIYFILISVTLSALNQQNADITGVMKFDIVNFNIGFNNISSFVDTGKLVIEKSGLYIISISVYSNTNGAEFYIYQNGQMKSHTRNTVGSWITETHVIALQLHNGDKVWVWTNSIYVSAGSYNSFSIIKVK